MLQKLKQSLSKKNSPTAETQVETGTITSGAMSSRLALSRTHLLVFVVIFAAFGSYFTFRSFAASSSTISGVAFKDVNRNGVFDPGEEPLVGKQIYAFDVAGVPVKHAATDAQGRYTLPDLAPGTYDVHYGTAEWWELWQDWAPSTTGSEQPFVVTNLTDMATVNFGWRPIIRSTDVNTPISSYIAPSGLKINSYNDVITAQKVYDALLKGSLFGEETKYTTIRFDYYKTSSCEASTIKTNGIIGDYRAICEISYLKWLDSGDATLFHEYGHAWSLYYTNIVQQDPLLTAYIKARGLEGDSRLWTNEEWSAREMIAEDYRELFGTANAAARTQANRDIPLAKDVPGLKDFLMGPFMQSPVDTTPPSAPANLTGKPLQSSEGQEIDISWTPSTDNVAVTKYNIYRNGTQVGNVNSPSTLFADTSLAASTSYQYAVSAVDAAGNQSPQSPAIMVKTLPPDTQAPTQPSNLKASSILSNSISLAWTASTDNVGVKEYRVYQIGGRKGTTANLLGSVPGTSFMATNLTPNTSYSFYVVAVDTVGNASQPSSTLTLKTKR